MQKGKTAELVCQHGTALDHCSICQPSLPYKAFARNIEEMVEAARPRLLQVAQLNGIGAEEAEDVVQETLIEAWRHLEQLHEPERLSAWLDGICRNICKRHIRAQATSLQTSELPTDEDEDEASVLGLPDPLAIDPAEELERQDMQVLLDRALGHLSTGTRELIELCYLAEMPQREVAQRLDMSLGALELKLHRARRQLRQVLHGELREDARTFGLLFDEDEAMGWKETRYWCWICGKQRMRATFEPQPGGFSAFRLRCPDCSARYAGDLINTGEIHLVIGAIRPFHLIGAMRSFRPALKRTMQEFADIADMIFIQRRCAICQSSVQIDLIDHNKPESTADASWPPTVYLQVTCPNCQPFVVEFLSVLLLNQSARTFLLERPRALWTPSVMDTYAGHEVIRSRLLDLNSGERLTIMTHPHTFQTMATILE